jgi:hypothetical protein
MSDPDELVDVVVELRDDPSAEQTMPALRASFESAAAPVAETIEQLGGSVAETAWINRTMRARVPARRLPELERHESVTGLDVPHRITPE